MAAAKEAFDKGMALKDAGNFDEACPLLEQAQKLDAGMATQFRIAECYEGAGRLASAWRNYTEVADAAHAAGMSEREQVARTRADALEPRLTRLVIEVNDALTELPGLQITRNGEVVGESLWGASVPVDGGKLRIEATAPGQSPWSTEVEAPSEGEALVVQVPADALQTSQIPANDIQPGTSPGGDSGTESTGMSGQALAGILVAATGVVVMGVGVGLGFAAKSSWDESNDDGHCSDDLCNADGLEIRDDARTLGTVSTVVFVVGAAALAGGGVLWLIAPSSDGEAAADSAAVRLGVAPNGLVLGGSW